MGVAPSHFNRGWVVVWGTGQVARPRVHHLATPVPLQHDRRVGAALDEFWGCGHFGAASAARDATPPGEKRSCDPPVANEALRQRGIDGADHGQAEGLRAVQARTVQEGEDGLRRPDDLASRAWARAHARVRQSARRWAATASGADSPMALESARAHTRVERRRSAWKRGGKDLRSHAQARGCKHR